jgi:UDP-sulfoquinovose synthase
LHPANAGSWYHNTKVLDQENFQVASRINGLRITDLHQGIVWGTETEHTQMDPRLTNRFDYDGDYGTVLNRFLMQAAVGHPLTVHGTGGQTRAFINIQDTARCVWLAAENAPERGQKPVIRNQVTESHRVRDLAKKVAEITDSEVVISNVENPRKEAAENELNVDHHSFDKLFAHLGIKPTLLDDGIMLEIERIAGEHKDRVDFDKIPARSLWVKK